MENAFISLYDETNIDCCPWPKNQDGEYGKKYLKPLIAEGVQHYISNVNVSMAVIIVKDYVLPITINQAHQSDSFICSPYSQYVSCTSVITDRIKNRFLKSSLKAILKIYSGFMKLGQIDKVIMVNNWLFTTSLHPSIDENTIKLVNDFLKNRFPEHAIVFRSVIEKTCSDCYNALLKNGYHLIANKYVYITDGSNEDVFKTRIFKSDLKFIKESGLKCMSINPMDEVDINSLQKLYNELYIKKHSKHSPEYTSRFLKLSKESGLLNLMAVSEDNQIEGVAGFFCREGQMVSPFFGYDPIKSEKGLYRYLSVQLLLEAKKNKLLFNQSAGGSFFKSVRRAHGNMEYTAVYEKHLPLARRIPWKVLSILSNTVGQRYMKRY